MHCFISLQLHLVCCSSDVFRNVTTVESVYILSYLYYVSCESVTSHAVHICIHIYIHITSILINYIHITNPYKLKCIFVVNLATVSDSELMTVVSFLPADYS